jgi:branched-chain amino acid transport system substrate-binding protein
VFRNLHWATERINARGGVRVGAAWRPLALQRFDSKGSAEEAVGLMRAAVEQGHRFILQGNSSATAAALIDALDKHNSREPQRRALFLNYSAVDPILTNERCSPWHFRFDAHADMRLAALVDVLRDERGVQKIYFIAQDYSFGQHVLKQARVLVAAKRPDMQIVGDELHPLAREGLHPRRHQDQGQRRAGGADAELGNDLALLVRALREVGSDAKLYTFYGNALGTPAAIGEAGVGRVLAVAEWHPNVGGAAFTRSTPRSASASPRRRTTTCTCARSHAGDAGRGHREGGWHRDRRRGARARRPGRGGHAELAPAQMRAADHQLQQPLVVSVMERAGTPGVAHDVEGSGFGFRRCASSRLPRRSRTPAWRPKGRRMRPAHRSAARQQDP